MLSPTRWRSFIPYYHVLPTKFGNDRRANIRTIRSAVHEVIEDKRKILETEPESERLNDCLSVMMKAETGNKTSNIELTDQVLTLIQINKYVKQKVFPKHCTWLKSFIKFIH